MNNVEMPKLFVGPWIGEFGVELLRWQSIARSLAKSRKWSEVIVATHPDRFFLYEDFATQFVPYIPKTIHTIGFSCVGHPIEDIHSRYINTEAGDIWLNPKAADNSVITYHPIAGSRSLFHNHAKGYTSPSLRYDLLIHARATPKANQHYKNWPVANYNALVEALPRSLKVASVGSLDGAHKIRGTEDLRGLPLKELAAYCGAAKLMIGPSSGTIHFGMHCNLPVVTWLQEDERYNYFPHWNPFDVPLCCMVGWQPDPQVVIHKTLEMLKLDAGRQQPIEMIFAASKRSGHHAILEWVTRLMPDTRIQLWNDCSTLEHASYPDEKCQLLTRTPLPKMLHDHSKLSTIFEWNHEGRHGVRFLSFEGIRLSTLASIPECRTAKRIVVIVRDIANTAASLKKGIPCLSNKGFLHPDFHRLREGMREYLLEAMGHTKHLAKFEGKVVFISYNRWHTEVAYRRHIAAALGLGYKDTSRGMMSTYAHKSAFQEPNSAAGDLDTINRWSHYAGNRHFWNLVCDSNTFALESEFHGTAMPNYGAWPT